MPPTRSTVDVDVGARIEQTARVQDALFSLFVVQAALVIACARLLALITRRFGQPMVIAEITAGIVLGPSVLGIFFPELLSSLFPASSMPTLSMFSNVGLVLFMFLVGLELDVRVLKGRRAASFTIAAASVLVPLLLGTTAAIFLHDALAPAAPVTPFALFVGAAMSVTAFPVLARILSERRLLGTKIGSMAISVAAISDVAVWCALAFLLALTRAETLTTPLTTTLLAVVFSFGVLAACRPLLARIVARAESTGATPSVIALVLFVVFAASVIADAIGIHPIFGAFLVGAAFPKRAALSGALSEKLEDLVVVFFLPLFFAYSGLRTELALLDEPADWLLCLLLIAVATLGKIGGVTITARLCGFRWRDAGAMGVLLNTRGLIGLVVLNIGLDLGIISPRVFTILVVMALVTTFLTSPLVRHLYPNISRSAQPREPSLATEAQSTFSLLLCVGERAPPRGLSVLARALADDDKEGVVALHLNDPEAGHEAGGLNALMDDAASQGLTVHPMSWSSQRPAEDIRAFAEAKRADLIIVDADEKELRSGGTARALLDDAPAATAVFFDAGLASIRRALVAVRAGRARAALLSVAARLRAHTRTDITLLTASSDVDPAEFGGPHGELDGVRAQLVDGKSFAHSLSRHAGSFDLVVLDIDDVDAETLDCIRSSLLVVGGRSDEERRSG